MQLSIAIVAFLVSLFTALIVFQKNKHSGTNVYLGLLIFFIGIYPVFNYLAVTSSSSEQALLWAKMILLVSIPQGPLLFFFAKTFPSKTFVFNKKLQIFITCWVLLNCILAISGMIFASVSVNNGVVSIIPGPLVPLFGMLHVGTIIAGLVVLAKKYRASKGIARRQLAYVYFGILISFALTFLITFVLPLFLNNTFLLALSPIFLTLAVLSVAHAIVAQRLFDIRLIVARSATYIILVTTLAFVYGLTIFGLTQFVFSEAQLSDLQKNLVYVVLAVILAVTFQPLKGFIDKITNRIFYQDAYDSQLVLNLVNKSLISGLKVKGITVSVAQIVAEHLKTEYCIFAIRETEQTPRHISGTKEIVFDEKDVQEAIATTTNLEARVFTLDEATESEPKLAKVMRKYNIEVLVRMVVQGNGIGYLLVGSKKSGNTYGNQDLNILEIISGEVAIAVQNALRYEEIEQFNVTLQKRIETATEKLQNTNEKLKALDEAKDEFISMASHQLRTPLTSVKGYISMLLEGDAGDLNKQQQSFLDQAYISSQRMVYLIADLLNVSRLKTGKFVIERRPVYLPDLVESEIAQLYETAKARELKFEFKAPKKFPMLSLDETKTRQVVMNFSDNAIYYTPKGGKITVEVKEVGKSVQFTVTDNGIGVPKSEQHHLFSKFYRAGNAKKARPDGTGLGLFMAKKVIAAQGGAILFRTQEGKGSTFGFTFPLDKIEITPDPTSK